MSRRLITVIIADAVAASRARLAGLAPGHPDDIRAAAAPVVVFSGAMRGDLAGLRTFLFDRLYRHPRVLAVMEGAERIVADLFGRYASDPAAMPASWLASAEGLSERRRARLVADFVAGMTDRYAIAEHRRLFGGTPELRGEAVIYERADGTSGRMARCAGSPQCRCTLCRRAGRGCRAGSRA